MAQQKLVSSEKTKNENNFYQEERKSFSIDSLNKDIIEIPLIECCEFIKDGTHGSFKDSDEGIPLLSAKDIRNGKIELDNSPRLINIDDYNKIHKNYEIENGDILLTIVGSIGRVALVHDEPKFSLQRSVAILRPKNNLNHYLFYLIQSDYFQNELFRLINFSAQGGVYLNSLKNIKIKLNKNKNEQEIIISALKNIDKKIELLEKKYQKVSLLKDYYYSEIFNILTLDTLKIEYRELSLEEIVTKFSTGLNPRKNFKLNDGGSNFYVTIKNFENGLLNLDEKCDKIDDNALNLINKRSDLKKDDLIFASIGRVGEVYLIKEDPVNWNINESVFSLRGDKNKVNPKFLYCLMKSKRVQHYFDIHITGSTFKSIKMKDLRKTPITLPCDISEQEYIADFLLKFEKKCYLMERQIKGFNQFKKGLLQKMFI